MRIDVIQANRPPRGRLEPERIAAIEAAASPGTRIVIRVPSEGPTSITTPEEDAAAAPNVLALIRAAAGEGADAVVVNCTADTAVAAARGAVPIPVIGVSEASFRLAAQLVGRFSVLTFAARIAPRFQEMARLWGVPERLASVRSVEMPLEAPRDEASLSAALAAASEACITDDGAEAVILGCTDFELAAPAVAAGLQARGLTPPLLRPYAIGLHLAEGMVRMGLGRRRDRPSHDPAGIATSQRSAIFRASASKSR